MSTSPLPPRTWKTWTRWFFWRLTFWFTVYTLSIGPFFWDWFESMHVDGPTWIAGFYAPLALLCDLCPPFGALVNWYINLWIL